MRAWDAGARRVPWSAVKLLRLLRGGDLGALRPEWRGWTLNRNGMVSPEGVAYSLGDLGWWSLTCRQAACWREDRHRQRQRGGGAAVPEPPAVSARSAAPVGEPLAGSVPRPDVAPPTAPVVAPKSVSEGVNRQARSRSSERQRARPARGLSTTQQVTRKRGKRRSSAGCSGSAGAPPQPLPVPFPPPCRWLPLGRQGVAAVRDLARRLRAALRAPVPAPEGLGWLLLAGALAAWLPFLLERIP